MCDCNSGCGGNCGGGCGGDCGQPSKIITKQGLQGLQGDPGAQGDPGPQGPAGPAGGANSFLLADKTTSGYIASPIAEAVIKTLTIPSGSFDLLSDSNDFIRIEAQGTFSVQAQTTSKLRVRLGSLTGDILLESFPTLPDGDFHLQILMQQSANSFIKFVCSLMINNQPVTVKQTNQSGFSLKTTPFDLVFTGDADAFNGSSMIDIDAISVYKFNENV